MTLTLIAILLTSFIGFQLPLIISFLDTKRVENLYQKTMRQARKAQFNASNKISMAFYTSAEKTKS